MLRNGKWCLPTLVILAGPVVAQPGNQSDIDMAWIAKAKAGIKPLVEKYNAMATRLDETREIEFLKKGRERKPKTLIVHQFPQKQRNARLGENMYVERSINKGGKAQVNIECQNSDYSFGLTKGKTGDYALADYQPGKSKNPLTDRAMSVHQLTFPYLARVLDILDKIPKELTKVRFDEANGRLRIVYHSADGASEFEYQLDPENDWCLVQSRTEDKYAVFTHSWTYGTILNGVRFPTEYRSTATYKIDEAPPDFESTDRVVSIKLTDKTEADFRMSAFGLKEPMGMPPVNQRSLLWLWISLAATASIVIALVLWKMRRKYETPSPAKI